jgi:hypothetical protein
MNKSTFKIEKNSQVVWVSYYYGEAFKKKNLKPSFKSRRSSISIWAVIFRYYYGPLVVLDGKINQDVY